MYVQDRVCKGDLKPQTFPTPNGDSEDELQVEYQCAYNVDSIG